MQFSLSFRSISNFVVIKYIEVYSDLQNAGKIFFKKKAFFFTLFKNLRKK